MSDVRYIDSGCCCDNQNGQLSEVKQVKGLCRLLYVHSLHLSLVSDPNQGKRGAIFFSFKFVNKGNDLRRDRIHRHLIDFWGKKWKKIYAEYIALFVYIFIHFHLTQDFFFAPVAFDVIFNRTNV